MPYGKEQVCLHQVKVTLKNYNLPRHLSSPYGKYGTLDHSKYGKDFHPHQKTLQLPHKHCLKDAQPQTGQLAQSAFSERFLESQCFLMLETSLTTLQPTTFLNQGSAGSFPIWKQGANPHSPEMVGSHKGAELAGF
jgi:hypothetical protein